MEAAPIFHFNDERGFIVEEVVGRVARETRDPVLMLNDAAFNEIKRLETARGPERAEIERFRDIARTVGRLGGEAEQRRALESLARHWALDIAGNFTTWVYKLSTGVLPSGLALLLSPKDFSEGFGAQERIRRHVITQGPVQLIRDLAKKGSLIFAPTHLSNLDSVVFGFGLETQSLPPVSYGAGKNLFSNPFLSFFMRNLGAYRVDRRIRAELYKEVLKTYSTVLLERGYHSLFFPGGTRSRSGMVEERLKLGLLGTGVEAFTRSLIKANRPERAQRVFIVPATINYLLTLEASTLIADHLAETGRSRFIIDDDESTQIERVATLVRKLVMTHGSVVIRYGQPVDPFGNRVTDDGRSIDHRGREVDPASYVTVDGRPVVDPVRDAQYTRELGETICRSYARETVLLATHLVAGAAFSKLRATHPDNDLFKLLRHRDVFLAHDEFERRVDDLLSRARDLEDREELVLGPGVRTARASQLIDEATKAWAGYHTSRTVTAAEGGFVLSDPNLLLYYQNRLAVSGLGFHQSYPRRALP